MRNSGFGEAGTGTILCSSERRYVNEGNGIPEAFHVKWQGLGSARKRTFKDLDLNRERFFS